MGGEHSDGRSNYRNEGFQPLELKLEGNHSDALVERLSRHQLTYSILGLLLGFVCVIGGILLFLAGVTGAVSWTARFLGASSELLDAAPGALLFVVGLFIVFVTRYNLQSTR